MALAGIDPAWHMSFYILHYARLQARENHRLYDLLMPRRHSIECKGCLSYNLIRLGIDESTLKATQSLYENVNCALKNNNYLTLFIVKFVRG